MTKVKPEAALSPPPPAAAPVPGWSLTSVKPWVERDRAGVAWSAGIDAGAQAHVAAAARALADFESGFRDEATALPETAAALAARAALVSALARQAQVREALQESASAAIDWADGQVAAVAHREAEWREQLALIDGRLPGLREGLAAATHALTAAASGLHARLRMAALGHIEQQLKSPGGLLTEELVGLLWKLVELESLRQSLANPFDATLAERFAQDAVPPGPPPPGPPPRTISDPFALPGAHAPRLLPGQVVMESGGIPSAAVPPNTTVVRAGPGGEP
jgi:hypothetical protein